MVTHDVQDVQSGTLSDFFLGETLYILSLSNCKYWMYIFDSPTAFLEYLYVINSRKCSHFVCLFCARMGNVDKWSVMI